MGRSMGHALVSTSPWSGNESAPLIDGSWGRMATPFLRVSQWTSYVIFTLSSAGLKGGCVAFVTWHNPTTTAIQLPGRVIAATPVSVACAPRRNGSPWPRWPPSGSSASISARHSPGTTRTPPPRGRRPPPLPRRGPRLAPARLAPARLAPGLPGPRRAPALPVPRRRRRPCRRRWQPNGRPTFPPAPADPDEIS